MKSRWVCPVCGYVHEGKEARHGAGFAGLYKRFFA